MTDTDLKNVIKSLEFYMTTIPLDHKDYEE